jgi:hypothetical protein
MAAAPKMAKPVAKPGVPAGAPVAAKPAATPAATKPAAKTAAAKPVVKPVAPAVDVTRIASRPNPAVDASANKAAMVIPTPPKTAEPGITLNPHSVALAPAVGAGARGATNLTPAQVAKRSQLKAMWNDGAAAKRRGDKAEARKIWTKGLKLAEASPRLDASAAGFRGSLAKLK